MRVQASAFSARTSAVQRVQAYLALQQPVISVDTKKKELVGDFKNAGQEWRAQGDPEKVRVHDFAIPELGRAAPYGVYDLELGGRRGIRCRERLGGLLRYYSRAA
jgi:hypothetical protein